MIKVLLIDDDQSFGQIVQTAFNQNEFSVKNATTGQEGLVLAKTDKPDLILLDEVLPDMRGNAVLIALKGDEQTAGIPVVVCSAYMNQEMEQDAKNHGALDYILKFELDPPLLEEKIKHLLPTRESSENSAS